MSVEGLQAILQKEPVIGTQSADTVCQNPQVVEDTYLRHVRTFIPIGRVAQGDEGAMTVVDFERRLIDLVKRAAAPTGYVTADYGYGKTSTCLFLWDRCRQANLLAVPPFQLVRLEDLLHVTHAWVRYEVGKRTPSLTQRADEIHRRYVARSIEEMAGVDAGRLAIYRDLHARGQLILEVPAARYVQFFEEMVALAVEAGFEGLVALPDELQQYLDPAIRTAAGGDPIAPLFDLVQGLVTRKGSLSFGLIFSIPRVTLTVLNDRRGDLVQRLKMHGLAFDLLTAYGPGFAAELWEHLTTTFDCRQEAARVAHPDALDALGQIAARDDLANGPRTVVNVFATMISRYLADDRYAPYGPLDLIADFLSGAITFDNTAKLRTIIHQHMASPLVAGNAERGRAVHLVAAFPTTGCTDEVAERYGLLAATRELASAGQGQVVIFLGGGMDREGKPLPMGMTLVGLEPFSSGQTDWLTATLKEFWRLYFEGDAHTLQRTRTGFIHLLRERIYTQPQFNVLEIREARLTQNAGLLLEGSFPGTARTYPKRKVHVRLLLDGEAARDQQDGDLTVEFQLHGCLDVAERERWHLPGAMHLDDPRTAVVALNLSHRDETATYADLQAVQKVINPHKLTPMFMLALHAFLEEKRAAGAIPQAEDQLLKDTFQASLLDRALAQLFNDALGAAVDRAGKALLEEVFRRQCTTLFPRYVTFVSSQQWGAGMRDYERALRSLPGVAERRGDQPLSLTKDELAKLLGRTATTLDNFLTTYPTLIKEEERFQGRSGGNKGVVRFTLHPLEQAFMAGLRQSGEIVPYQWGKQTKQVHRISRDALYAYGQQEGYRDEEIKAALELLATRELIVLQEQQRMVVESPRGSVDRSDVLEAIGGARALLTPLLAHYAAESGLRQHQEQFTKLEEILGRPDKPEEGVLIRLLNDVEARKRQILTFIADREAELRRGLAEVQAPPPVEPARLGSLGTPVKPQLFGTQLESVRRILLADAQRYQQVLEDWQGHRRQLAAQGRSEAPDAEALVGLARGLEALRKGAGALFEQRQAFDRRFGGFERCDDALDTAAQIERLLDGAGEADEAAGTLRERFDRLLLSINGELSSRKVEALEGAGDWALALRRLRGQVEEVLVGEQARFADLQERYRKSLVELGVAPERMPAPTPFNRQDPQGSLNKLHDDVRRALEGRLDPLPLRLDGFRSLLNQQARRCADHAPEAVAPIRARIETIAAALDAHKRTAVELSGQAGDLEIIADYPAEGEGRYQRFLLRLKDLLAASGQVRATINEVASALDKLTDEPLTEEQRALLATIRQAPGSAVDISAIVPDGADVAHVLSTLAALYKKGRVLIQVSVPPGTGR